MSVTRIPCPKRKERRDRGRSKRVRRKVHGQYFSAFVLVVEFFEVPDECYKEDIQLFALVLINSAVVLGGEFMGDHPKILRSIQDYLFHHLVVNGTRSTLFFYL